MGGFEFALFPFILFILGLTCFIFGNNAYKHAEENLKKIQLQNQEILIQNISCPFCSIVINGHVNYCQNCGKRIFQCYHCMKYMDEQYSYCIFCGKELNYN